MQPTLVRLEPHAISMERDLDHRWASSGSVLGNEHWECAVGTPWHLATYTVDVTLTPGTVCSPDDDRLDDAFPLGDGTVDTDVTISCPYCGEAVDLALDPGGGASQQYVEDCQVCCQPWRVSVRYDRDGRADVSVAAIDE